MPAFPSASKTAHAHGAARASPTDVSGWRVVPGFARVPAPDLRDTKKPRPRGRSPIRRGFLGKLRAALPRQGRGVELAGIGLVPGVDGLTGLVGPAGAVGPEVLAGYHCPPSPGPGSWPKRDR